MILANINRNALIELIPELLNFLNEGGRLLLSGLLEEDEETMLEQPALKELSYMGTRRHDEWIALLFQA